MIEILPTTVPRNLDELIEAARVVAPFSKKIHIDVNDGIFVPQVSWPFLGADMYGPADLFVIGEMLVETHLMVHDPRMIGRNLIRAGAQTVIGHIEACTDAHDAEEMLTMWRTCGAREVGLAILIDTPIEKIMPCVTSCDVIQIMSVARVGAQGASFDPRAIEKVRKLHEAHPNAVIAVDGGVSLSNIGDLVSAGATHFDIGSAIMKVLDPSVAYGQLHNKAIAGIAPHS